MPPVTSQVPGNGTGTLSYAIPGDGLDVETVYVAIDATAAGGGVTAELTIQDQSGVVIARKTQGETIAAGGTGSATWALRLDDEGGGSPCCTTGDTPYPILVGRSLPRAIWPFDESAGATAADASGNGWDLSVAGVGALGPGTWAWAQAAGPPGTQAPTVTGGGPQATNAGFPSLTNNFAAACWVNVINQFQTEPAIMRQGDPYNSIPGGGWTMHMASATGKFYALWSTGAAYHSVTANAASAVNTWHLVGFQYVNGTGYLWLDGVLQTNTDTGVIAAATGITFARANGGGYFLRGQLSYGMVWDRPLTDAEWTALATPGTDTPAGYLLQANGVGGSFYGPLASGSAPAGYKLYSDGAGGTYWAP